MGLGVGVGDLLPFGGSLVFLLVVERQGAPGLHPPLLYLLH